MVFAACTIGGEESQGVVTIESTTATTVIDEEITFEEGVLEFAQCMREELSLIHILTLPTTGSV